MTAAARRKSIATIVLIASVLLVRPPGVGAQTGDVVAQAGGYRLSRADVERGLAVYDVAAGTKLPASDRAELQRLFVSEFERNPATLAQQYASSASFIDGILARRDRFQLAALRETAWETLIAKAPTSSEAAAGLRLLERHVPILAQGGGMIVTQSEAEAYLDTEDGVASAAGQPKRSAASRAAFVRTLPSRFASLPAPVRVAIAHGQSRELAITAMLNDSVIAYGIRKEVHGCIHSAEDVPTETRSMGDSAMTFMLATGQWGSYRGADSSDLADQAAARFSANDAQMKLRGGLLFWPNQPCGHN